MNRGETLFISNTGYLPYTVDIDLFSRNPEVLKESFVHLEEASRREELKGNEDETKHIVM